MGCFDLPKLISYLYKTKHNGDDWPKVENHSKKIQQPYN